uniref:uncharacterized protein LOC122586845 isoform X1 n=1 Tax=Erigeron canadensis TaxID=72917 RepID=UPI001CB98804|nr:uncharacterized protein LOC122586845 isoform X1 [Erigeron canadensis]
MEMESIWWLRGGWMISYSVAVVTLVSVWHLLKLIIQIIPSYSSFSRLWNSPSASASAAQSNHPVHTTTNTNNNNRIMISSSHNGGLITDFDLKLLMDNLEDDADTWETVVERRNNSLSYSVKCCKPKDGGPLKYLSTTIFNFCSSETLRDFYMDNFYRMEWDKTLIDHRQLQVDENSGTEIGRTIKKFPLLTPREYILAWRLWEGRDQTYYCYSKECDHPLAPTQKKYVRVSLFRSGWRIKAVPGGNSCQIKMVHQEDAGLNVEMAKVIFAKGIWSYVCKMDNALRMYSAIKRLQLTSTISAITLVQKVPLPLESTSNIDAIAHSEVSYDWSEKEISRKSSKKLLVNGLILAGGVICLARGHTNFSAKVAMSYALSKLTKRHRSKEPSLH